MSSPTTHEKQSIIRELVLFYGFTIRPKEATPSWAVYMYNSISAAFPQRPVRERLDELSRLSVGGQHTHMVWS